MKLQIYTGYKWRPLTPEEIEIMDATRVLPFKSEEPDAGDIYQGMDAVSETILNLNGIQIVPEGVLFTPQNWGRSKRALQEPCVYCSGKLNEQKVLESINGNVKLRVGIATFAEYYDDVYDWQYDLFNFDYCPKCGRKLRVSE